MMKTFIDLELIAKENNLPDKSKRLFLERLGTNTGNSGLFKNEGIHTLYIKKCFCIQFLVFIQHFKNHT